MSHATQLHNRRYFDDYLEIINRHGLPGNVKHEVCQQVRGAVLTTVQTVIEHALREEGARTWAVHATPTCHVAGRRSPPSAAATVAP